MTHPRKRLLIADDEAELRFLIRQVLKESYDVFEAADGRQAVQVSFCTRPDVVLLDLMLPMAHGFDVLAQLRRSPLTERSTIVVLSACDSPKMVETGLALGANLFMAKPFTPLALKQLLHTLETT